MLTSVGMQKPQLSGHTKPEEHLVDQVEKLQYPKLGLSSAGDHLEVRPTNGPIPEPDLASRSLNLEGNFSSLSSISSVATIGVSALETSLKTYIDAKFDELETRVMERMANLERNLSSKLNLLLDRS